MAENFEGTKPLSDFQKPDQQTLKVDPTQVSTAPETNPETIDILDNWHKELEKAAVAPPKTEGAEGDDPPADDPPADDPPADDPPADDPPADDPPADDPPADAPPADDPPPAETDFNKIELPANARGKSAEAFAQVKAGANAQINQLTTELTALRSELQQLKEGTAEPLTDEVKTELESLRQFKARLDIEADPNFHREFDGKIQSLEGFVVAQLKSTGKFGDKALSELKSTGFDKIDWDALFKEVNNPRVERLVQSKLDEIEVTKFNKQQKLDALKANVGEYIESQRKEYEKAQAEHEKATAKQLDEILPKLPWLVQEDKPLAATATPDERLVWEDNRKFKGEVKACLQEALRDDSPNMRAVLIAGMAQLLKLRREHAVVVESQKRDAAALKEAQAKIAKFKRGSITRPKETSAPSTPTLQQSPIDPNLDGGSAMDLLAKQAGLR